MVKSSQEYRGRRIRRARQTRTTRADANRRGAATVEFAFCAPIFFMLVFAGIEIARINMMIQTLESACINGARQGILPGATAADVQAATAQTMDISLLDNYTIAVEPTNITDNTETVTVTVSVPVSDNGYVLPGIFGGKTISKSVEFRRE